MRVGGVPFRCSRQQLSDYASGFGSLGNLNSCQIAYSTLGSSVRKQEVPGSLIPEGYTMPILFLWSPDSRPAGNGRQSQPSERGYLCPGPAAAARGAIRAAGQLRSPPALPRSALASWPCPSLERLFIYLHRLAGLRRETRQLLLAKLSSRCAGVGLSKTTKRFALDSLAFFFFFLSSPSL